MEKSKRKHKYALWFLIVIGAILWSLTTQLIQQVMILPLDWSNFALWFRVIASGIAIYGTIWLFKIYMMNERRKEDKANGRNAEEDSL